MCDVEWIIDINISVGVPQQIVEDVFLQGIRGFHDEGIKIQPPEPLDGKVSQSPQCRIWGNYHSALGYLRIQFRMVSTFSQLSRHSCAYLFLVLISTISRS